MFRSFNYKLQTCLFQQIDVDLLCESAAISADDQFNHSDSDECADYSFDSLPSLDTDDDLERQVCIKTTHYVYNIYNVYNVYLKMPLLKYILQFGRYGIKAY